MYTMKLTLLLFSCLLALALAQDAEILAQWSGSTVNSDTFKAPTITNNVCGTAIDSRNFVVVNYTFASAGTRQVALLAEPSFKNRVQVYLYAGSFDPANSCNSIVRQLVNTNYNLQDLGVLTVNDPVEFEASTYYFVITSDVQGEAGRFALTVYGSQAFGTTIGGITYTPPSISGTCTVAGSPSLSIGVVNFQELTDSSVLYDVTAFFARTSAVTTNTVYFAIYEGTLTANDVAADPCSATLSPALRVTAQEGDFSAQAWRQTISRSQPYTIVVGATNPGAFAVQITPTKVHTTAAERFAQPNRALPCTASSSATESGFVSLTFVAQHDQYLVDTYNLPSWFTPASFASWAFVYSGDNSNAETCPSGASLVAVGETQTGGPVVFSTARGRTYTIIIATSDGSAAVGQSSQVFLLGGPYVGNPASYTADPAVSTTGSSSSSSSSLSSSLSSSSASSASSSSLSSSSSSTTGTTGETDEPATSDSSAVAFSLFLLAAAVVAAFL